MGINIKGMERGKRRIDEEREQRRRRGLRRKR